MKLHCTLQFPGDLPSRFVAEQTNELLAGSKPFSVAFYCFGCGEKFATLKIDEAAFTHSAHGYCANCKPRSSIYIPGSLLDCSVLPVKVDEMPAWFLKQEALIHLEKGLSV